MLWFSGVALREAGWGALSLCIPWPGCLETCIQIQVPQWWPQSSHLLQAPAAYCRELHLALCPQEENARKSRYVTGVVQKTANVLQPP